MAKRVMEKVIATPGLRYRRLEDGLYVQATSVVAWLESLAEACREDDVMMYPCEIVAAFTRSLADTV